MKDLFAQQDEIRTDKIQAGQGKKALAAFMPPTAPVRRPAPSGRGKGHSGQKTGLGFSAQKSVASTASAVGEINVNGDEKKPKSNADFKAMFVSEGAQ